MSQHQAADPGPVTLEVPASHQALGQKLKNSYSEYSENIATLVTGIIQCGLTFLAQSNITLQYETKERIFINNNTR